MGTWEEAREEDGHPGGSRQTESMVEMMGEEPWRTRWRGEGLGAGGARWDSGHSIKVSHGGADRETSHGEGRADDSRGPNDGCGAARGRDGEPEGRGEARATEDRGEAEVKEELDRDGGMRRS